jgi:hypothetical protein
MKIERRWGFLTQMLGALFISVILLSGCGGSSQSAGSASDASSAAAVTPPASTGTDSTTGTGGTPITSTPGASSPVATTPVASTPVASPVASTSSSGSSSGGTSGSGSSGTTTTADNVTLSWSAPTENTNGSALTNLAGYIIYYGTSASAMTQTIDVNTVGVLNYVVDNLSAGSWYFQIVAVNAAGEQSSPSAIVSASI